MNNFTTSKSALIDALEGKNEELSKEIIVWLNGPSATSAKPQPQPADDETIIITRPH